MEFAASVMPTFDPGLSTKIKDTLIDHNVAVYNDIAIKSIDKRADMLVVKGTERFEATVDMVLDLCRSLPNTALGRSIGLVTGTRAP